MATALRDVVPVIGGWCDEAVSGGVKRQDNIILSSEVEHNEFVTARWVKALAVVMGYTKQCDRYVQNMRSVWLLHT